MVERESGNGFTPSSVFEPENGVGIGEMLKSTRARLSFSGDKLKQIRELLPQSLSATKKHKKLKKGFC